MTDLRTKNGNRKELVEYLLGDMDAAATEEFESRMFEDNDLFYEMVDLENEIADSYLNGSLDIDTRKKVEERAAANAGFAEKLRNAKALHSHLAESSMRISDVVDSEPEEGWLGRMMARMGLSALGAPAMVSAALLILVLGVAGFLLYDRIMLGREMVRIKAEQQSNSNADSERIRELEKKLAEVEKSEKDLGTRLEQNQGQSEILEEQLAKERSEREALQRELNRIRNREMNRGTAPQPRVATVILAPFAGTRGPGGSVKALDLKAGVERVSATLQIPSSFEGDSFTVTYKGKKLASDAAAKTRSGFKYVVVSIPAADVSKDGDNVLRLTSEEGETTTYVFRAGN